MPQLMTGKENIQLKTPRKVQYLPESVGFIIVTADYNLQALWWFCIAWLRGSSGTSWLALYSHHHWRHIMFYIIKLCLCFPPGITFSLLLNSFRWHHSEPGVVLVLESLIVYFLSSDQSGHDHLGLDCFLFSPFASAYSVLVSHLCPSLHFHFARKLSS